MEILPNGLTLDIPADAFPLSTDSILLADFVRPKPDTKVLDLGSGCGTLGLLLCAQSRCSITGIELNPSAHLAALANIRRNALEHRIHSICGDVRELNQLVPPGSYEICLSNPPYFSGGPVSQSHPTARCSDNCSPEELFQGAAWALKYGGDFFLVHKPEMLAHLCGCAVKAGLEPKRLRLVRHRENGPVTLILLSCRKGGKPGLIWEDRCLYSAEGRPTPYFKELYHIQE
jgi:tRNA1(Val) A37 N6-methylase TrmN6